ncbi:MAG: hypothetical protein LC793_24040 [Thermomicrobia bacterium]|nr:hypothetical protein [Thermomicrobia bacterium]
MTTALDVTRRASWFVAYAASHWSLNLSNELPSLPEPYRITQVRSGCYTVMLGKEKVGTWKGTNKDAFEQAIVGCWNDMDQRAGRELQAR